VFDFIKTEIVELIPSVKTRFLAALEMTARDPLAKTVKRFFSDLLNQCHQTGDVIRPHEHLIFFVFFVASFEQLPFLG